jgi:hypothetical protein
MLVREGKKANVVSLGEAGIIVSVNESFETGSQVRPDELILFEHDFGGLPSNRPAHGEQLPVWFFVFAEVVKACVAYNSILATKHLAGSNAVAPDMIAQFLGKGVEKVRQCACDKKSAIGNVLRT